MVRLVSAILLLALATPAWAADDVIVNPGRNPSPGFHALFAPDGKTAVTFGSDRSMRVWELDTAKLLAELWIPDGLGQYSDGRWYSLGSIWISPDGKTIAMQYVEPNPSRYRLVLIPVAGPDRGTYRVMGEFPGGLGDVVFSPDGKRVATTSGRSSIVVWEVATGKQVCQMKFDPDMAAQGMSFTPDGTRLTVALPMVNFNGDKHSGISTFDATTGKFLGEIPWRREGLIEDVNSPRWSPDGKTLAVKRTTMELLNADGTRKKAVAPPDPITFPDAGAFDSKGRFLVAWRRNGEYTVRDELAGKEVTRFKQPGEGNWRIQFAADGSRVLLSGDDSLAFHDLTGNAPTTVLPVAERPATTLAWGAGRTLAWGTESVWTGKGRLGHALDFAQLKTVKFDPKDFTRYRAEWDGAKLTHDGYRATATVNGKEVKLAYEPEFDSDDIKAFTLVGPGHAVLATGPGVYGYDTKTGTQVCSYPSGAWVLSPTADGKLFAATYWSVPLVRVFKPGESEPVLTLYTAGTEWVAWTRDGAWFSSEGGATKFAGTLTKPEPGKLRTFAPLDPKNRDADKVKAALK
jgi:WD40 repeat protein